MDIKVHTVGRITTEGRYDGWYVFIQTYKNSDAYLILTVNSKAFGRDENGNHIEGLEGYDSWMPDMISMEHHFEVNKWQVEWLDEPKPAWLEDEAE